MPFFLLFLLAGVAVAAASTKGKGKKRRRTVTKAVLMQVSDPLERVLAAISQQTSYGDDWPSPYSYGQVLAVAQWLVSLESYNFKTPLQPGVFYNPNETIELMKVTPPGTKPKKRAAALVMNYIIRRYLRPTSGRESVLHAWVREVPSYRVQQYQALVTWAVMWILAPITNAPPPNQDKPRTPDQVTAELLTLNDYIRKNFEDSDYGDEKYHLTENAMDAMHQDILARPTDIQFRCEQNIRMANETIRATVDYTQNWKPEQDGAAGIVGSVVAVIVSAVAAVVSLGTASGFVAAETAVLITGLTTVVAAVMKIANSFIAGDVATGIRAFGGLLMAVDKATGLSGAAKAEAQKLGVVDDLIGYAQAGVSVGVVQTVVESGIDRIIGINIDDMLTAAKSVGVDPVDVGLKAPASAATGFAGMAKGMIP